jgi:hypothetical protein
MKKLITIIAVGALLGGCSEAAHIASNNLSKAADNFEVPRRISVVNGITDRIVMKMEGFCSLQSSTTVGRMAVVCKMEDGDFVKNFIDKSDNVFILTEQLETINVSTFQYRVVFRPQSLIPDIDFQGDAGELINNSNTDG